MNRPFQLPKHLPPQTAMTLFELFSELSDAIWQQYETDLVQLIISERDQPPEPQHDPDFDDDIFF
jgi:hypothetical protein